MSGTVVASILIIISNDLAKGLNLPKRLVKVSENVFVFTPLNIDIGVLSSADNAVPQDDVVVYLLTWQPETLAQLPVHVTTTRAHYVPPFGSCIQRQHRQTIASYSNGIMAINLARYGVSVTRTSKR